MSNYTDLERRLWKLEQVAKVSEPGCLHAVGTLLGMLIFAFVFNVAVLTFLSVFPHVQYQQEQMTPEEREAVRQLEPLGFLRAQK